MSATRASARKRFAEGVYRLETGRGLTRANVYFVRSGPAWVLIDTAWPHRGPVINAAAESLFGAGHARRCSGDGTRMRWPVLAARRGG
jgi:hypothetical protein